MRTITIPPTAHPNVGGCVGPSSTGCCAGRRVTCSGGRGALSRGVAEKAGQQGRVLARLHDLVLVPAPHGASWRMRCIGKNEAAPLRGNPGIVVNLLTVFRQFIRDSSPPVLMEHAMNWIEGEVGIRLPVTQRPWRIQILSRHLSQRSRQ